MNRKNEEIRTFLALDPPENIKEQIFSIYSPLKNKYNFHIKWIPVQNLHITVKFLGNVSNSLLKKIIQRFNSLNLNLNINLVLNTCGVFPVKGIPRILWVSFIEKPVDNKLFQLNQLVEKEMNNLGFAHEKRGFKPHITIARFKFKERPNADEFNRFLNKLKLNLEQISEISFKIDNLSLFKSELTPKGAIYSIIEQF